MGQKQKKIRQTELQDLGRRTRDLEKWDQTDRPEIPGVGRHPNRRPPLIGG